MPRLPQVRIRLLMPGDAESLSRLELENREYLLSGAPVRPDDYVTAAGQRDLVGRLLREYAAGVTAPYGIEVAGALVGRITLNDVRRGPLQSAVVGYWVAERWSGRGVASTALRFVVEIAFGGWGLHRLEAGTTPENEPSARALISCGFEQYGYARDYLLIGGRWQDHRLFQLLNPHWDG